MVNKIATRIQSRLSRKGLKVTLGEIKTVYSQMVADDQNPTDAEVDQVTEYFISQSSKLATVGTEVEEEDLTPVATGNDQSDENEPVHNLYTSVNTTPQAEETEQTETSVCAGGEIGNIATPAQIEPETLDQAENVGAIALQETSELVASTAESMGIALNIEDVRAIAENFDHSSQDSDDELEEIKAAIVGFVQHKSALSRQKITNIVQEVKDTIHHLDAENSQHLNDGLRSISEDIKSGSERFRNQTRQALKVFALPPSKAG